MKDSPELLEKLHTCRQYFAIFIYIVLHSQKNIKKQWRTPMTSRGYTTEDGGRLNNFRRRTQGLCRRHPTVRLPTSTLKKLNGRLAMIGFVSAIAFELMTGQGIVTWLTNL